MTTEELQALFLPHQVDCVGIAAYEPLLPLLPVRSRRRIPAAARSVLVCLFPYYVGEYPQRNISRYTIIPDYHTIGGEILTQVSQALTHRFPENDFVWFLDASPIREVEAALAAGLGVRGRNGQLIHPVYGSYVFIGEIVTDLECIPSQPLGGSCLECGRCLRACPSGALGENGVDLSLCRSQLTQKKGELSAVEAEEIAKGAMVWGCDRCTDCCPHNWNPVTSPIHSFYENVLPRITQDNLPTAMVNRALNYRGEAVLRRNLNILSQIQGKHESR